MKRPTSARLDRVTRLCNRATVASEAKAGIGSRESARCNRVRLGFRRRLGREPTPEELARALADDLAADLGVDRAIMHEGFRHVLAAVQAGEDPDEAGAAWWREVERRKQ